MSELTRDQILGSLEKLDRLSNVEYGAGLLDVMDDPARLRRLAGLMIKEPFARPDVIPTESAPGDTAATPRSITGARQSWTWDLAALNNADRALPEFQMLDALRDWRGLGSAPRGFEVLAEQAETERGLFKVAALWLQDRLRGKETRSLREYYGAAESARFEGLLDVADNLAVFALTPVYAAVFPAGALAVPFVLIAAKYGYRRLFEAGDEPDERDRVRAQTDA